MQRVAVAFLFAIETAMRSGEILGLTSLTVDKVVSLPSALTRRKADATNLGVWPRAGVVSSPVTDQNRPAAVTTAWASSARRRGWRKTRA